VISSETKFSTISHSISNFIYNKSPLMGQVKSEKIFEAIDLIEVGI